jgi:autotransporter-associated beta strand protein
MSHITKTLAVIAFSIHTVAPAANYFKANNAAALNVATSWINKAVPGSGDIAGWDANVLAANTTNSLGANTTWAGIKILNPGGPVQLNAGFNLTNGAGGIDLSTATQDLTLSNNVIVGVPQYWNAASGRTLTLGNSLIKSAGGAVRFELADSTANVVVTNPTSAFLWQGGFLPFGTVNDTDFAAVNGNGQIAAAASVISYTANPTGNFKSTTAVPLDFTAAGAGLTLNGNAVVNSIRINQANTANPNWTINTGTKVLSLGALLVTTNVGNQPVYFNGGGSVRVYSANELLLFQNNLAAPVVFLSTAPITQYAAGAVVTKLGAGTVEIQSAGSYTGGTRVYEGNLILTGGTLGSAPLNIFGGTFTGSTTTTNFAPTLVSAGATNAIRINTANGRFIQATNLILNAGAHLLFSPTNTVSLSTTAAPLVVTNLNTTLYVSNTVTLDVAASPAAGQYPLIKYATLGANGFSAFSLNLQPHITAYLSNNTANSSIDLVVTANNQPLRWAAGNGVWDVAATADWQDASGAATTYQQAGIYADAVVLNDAASGASPITVSLNTNAAPASIAVTASKNYILTGTGGIGGNAAVTKSNSGTLTLATTNSFAGGLIINGGTVSFSTSNNLGSGPITLAGGTLWFNGTSDDISFHPLTFNAGGGTINDGGAAVVFANPVGNSGAGGLTKLGAGSLTLNGTNNYAGNTVVGAGTLALAAASYLNNSAAIIVSNGATLDVSANSPILLQNQILAGSGAVTGGVIITNGATLTPGTNGVAGTLTINGGDLTVSGGTLALDVASGASDLVVVNGDLNLTSGALKLNVTGTLPNGSYKLIQYSKSLTGAAGNLAITGFSQAGQTAALSGANAGEIDLVVSSAGGLTLVWQGDGSGNNWDVGGTADWTNSAGGAATFANADNVIFNDTSANQTVNLASTVQPGTVTVNSAQNYTFQDSTGTGAGKISGPASLTKSGSGLLTVLTVNNNSGPTVISAGTLQVGYGDTTGDLGTGNITNNGTLIFSQPDDRNIAGSISGTGTLTQQGSGTLTLAANNSYSGATTVSSGTLQIGAGGTTGTLGTGPLVANSTVVVNRTGAYALTNNISGYGPLTIIGGGTVALSGNNSYQNGTIISNGLVQIAGTAALPTGALYVDGTLDLNGHNQTVTSLNGVSGLITNTATTGTNTLVVGDDSDTSTFSGVITENTGGTKLALIKRGGATLQFNGVNSYSGGTLVVGGQLNIGPSGVVGGSSTPITLTNGTTLYLANSGSLHPAVGNTVNILDGSAATLGSGNLANTFDGTLAGGVSATNIIGGSLTFSQLGTKQFEPLLGTVVIASGVSLRFSTAGVVSANGGDNTTFDLEGTLYSKSGGTFTLGALEGGGTISAATAGSQTFIVGGKGGDSTFSGTISTGNGLVKVGTGTLTLNGSVNYDGATTVSNGVLALASDSTSLDASPTITLGASTAAIDVSGRSDGTLWLGNGAAQTLAGLGAIRGSLSEAAGSTINAGLGVLTVTNTATFNGAVNLLVSRTNSVNAIEIVAGGFTVNSSATLTVTNAGPAFQGGEVFRLFSKPVDFTSVTLPAISSPLSWNNRLAIDGTLAVLGTIVNTNPAPLVSSFTNGTLSLSWPSDHIGWHLQVQTNSIGTGFGANWVNVAGTYTNNQASIPINPANGAVFFRLAYP